MSEKLQQRVAELELELAEREKDLALFRRELARTNKRLESLIGNLSREIRMVHVVQAALVPTEIPTISGFDFSTKFVSSFQLGGDYLDIFEHDDRSRFGIVVASSSDHGVSALLMSVLLNLTGQMEARRGSEPIHLIRNIANELTPEMGEGSSVDILYGLFDRRSYEFSFCLAGEVLALHYDYGEQELRLLEVTSGPIQAKYSHRGTCGKLILNPRDRLIICTRGMVEEKNGTGESYGRERLFGAVLSAIGKDTHALRNEILFQVQQFTGGKDPSRDLSVIVADVKDRVIKLMR